MRGLALTLTRSSIIAIVAIAVMSGIIMLNIALSAGYSVDLNTLSVSDNPYAYNVQNHIKYLYGVISHKAFEKYVECAKAGIPYLKLFVRYSTVKFIVGQAVSLLFPLAVILVNIACTLVLRNLTTRSALQALASMTRSSIAATASVTVALISLCISLPLSLILYASLAPLVSGGPEFCLCVIASVFLFLLTSALIPLPLFLWFQNEFAFIALGMAEFFIIVGVPSNIPYLLFPSIDPLLSLKYPQPLQTQPLLQSLALVAVFLTLSWLSVRRCELY